MESQEFATSENEHWHKHKSDPFAHAYTGLVFTGYKRRYTSAYAYAYAYVYVATENQAK